MESLPGLYRAVLSLFAYYDKEIRQKHWHNSIQCKWKGYLTAVALMQPLKQR